MNTSGLEKTMEEQVGVDEGVSLGFALVLKLDFCLSFVCLRVI
jgi:hypothetical protein